MRVDKFLRTLRGGEVRKRASLGERVLGSLFPHRGYSSLWSSDRTEQVHHLTRWVYVCANLICSKIASIMPNLAYVVDQPKRGVTTKAGQRGLLNLMGRGYGGSTDVGGNYDYRLKSSSNGSAYNYSEDWREVSKAPYPASTFHPLGPAEGGQEFGFSDGGHSWLTMGEYRSKSLSVVKPHEDLEPLESDHPLRRLIENPNPFDTHYDIEYEKWMFKLLCGVAYEWFPKNEWGQPAERWCIPSHWVWPRTGGGRYVSPDALAERPHADELIEYYEIRPWGGMGSAGVLKFPPDEVVMEISKSPINKIDGYSPLAAMAQWIDLDESISKSRWAQMMNQARPELWIELGPGYEDPNDDRIARIEAKLAARFQGEYNYAKPIVTPPGAKLTPLSYTPNEMAYGNGSDQTRDMLLSGFLVPPSAVGLVREMTYGSILATLGALCAFCLNPKLAASGQTQTKHLASRFDEKTPSFSQRNGVGGRSGKRRVRLWYDDCLDAETECLTAEGWKRHEELTEETRIACYDDETETLIYRKPRRMIRRNHDGVLHVWEGGRISAAMTPNHRVWVQRRPTVDKAEPKWMFKLAGDLTPALTYRVRRAAPAACDAPAPTVIDRHDNYHQQRCTGTEAIDPHLWLEFLGYFLSEGCLWRNKEGGAGGSWLICIAQTERNANFGAMEKCIGAVPGSWKKYRKKDNRSTSSPCVHFQCTDRGLYEHLLEHCGQGASQKRVPNYVKSWPAADLKVLLDALIAGDGRKPSVNANTGVWNSQYVTTSKQLADDVMEIAIKCGLAASITKRKKAKEHHAQAYTVNLSSRVEVMVLPEHRLTVPYSGPVWCVEVPTGKFVVRRNGMAHITGNCVPADPQQVNSDIAADLSGYAITPDEVRALRGRKPYPNYGNVPWVQGPGGVAPYPINGDSLDVLAQQLQPMAEMQAEAKAGASQGGQSGPGPVGGEGDGGARSSGPTAGPVNRLPSAEGDAPETDFSTDAGIEEPNGPPTKYWSNGRSRDKSLTW